VRLDTSSIQMVDNGGIELSLTEQETRQQEIHVPDESSPPVTLW
jgi:hypothetical protein